MARTKIQRFSIKECLHAGWHNVFCKHYALVVFVATCCCVIGVLVVQAAIHLETQMPFAGLFGSAIADPVFFASPFILVRTLRGENFQISLPAAGSSAILKILAFGVLLRLIVWGCAMSCLVTVTDWSRESNFRESLALLLAVASVVIATYLTLRLCFTPFVLMESSQQYSLPEAMSHSWRMTREPIGSSIFILWLCTGFICVACMWCAIVPIVLVGLPLMGSVFAAAYEFARPLRIEDARDQGPAGLRARRCESCGYSRSGVTQDRCPECGEPYSDSTYVLTELEAAPASQGEPPSPA
jgi:hypothetical protein